MPSSIWTGSISFGLVQVPVKLVGATKSKDVSFNQLEKGSGARIRYRKVSDATGDEVTADQIEKGYEVSKGKYVIVEPSEIETLRPKGGHEIEIEEFVDLDDIDPLYFEQPYYLVPESDTKLTEKERTMAQQLVESLASEAFEPEKYHDQYREQLLDLIARKESGAEITAEPQTEPPAKVLDLVAALEASIAKSKTAKERHPTGSATKAKAVKATAKGSSKPAAKATKAPAKKAARARKSA